MVGHKVTSISAVRTTVSIHIRIPHIDLRVISNMKN